VIEKRTRIARVNFFIYVSEELVDLLYSESINIQTSGG
jgi:hypothetical protein